MYIPYCKICLASFVRWFTSIADRSQCCNPEIKTMLRQKNKAKAFSSTWFTSSILEARTNVTKKKDRILIKDLISYKLKYQIKEARLILQ